MFFACSLARYLSVYSSLIRIAVVVVDAFAVPAAAAVIFNISHSSNNSVGLSKISLYR